MSIPQDPYILLSYLNTQLRDKYASLTALCEDLDESQTALEEKNENGSISLRPHPQSVYS